MEKLKDIIIYNTINLNSIVTFYIINNFRKYIIYMRGFNDIGNLILDILCYTFIICYLKIDFKNF